MTLATVRTGLQTRLATISGLRVYDVWPDQINPPAAIVKPLRLVPHTTFASRGSMFFEVVLALQIATLERGQNALDPYLDFSGSQSLVAAIEGDTTLGGAAEDIVINEVTDYGVIKIDDIDYIGARLEMEVFTKV